MPTWELLAAFLLFPTFYALAIWDARRLLHVWATKEGLRLLQVENRLIHQGPFRHRLSCRQLVFLVRVLGRDREEKKGFVCCGHHLWGTTFGQVEARWNEEPIQLPEPTSGLAPGRGSS